MCIDRIWLRGSFEGELLKTISMDPNDKNSPIAWDILANENEETWM